MGQVNGQIFLPQVFRSQFLYSFLADRGVRALGEVPSHSDGQALGVVRQVCGQYIINPFISGHFAPNNFTGH